MKTLETERLILRDWEESGVLCGVYSEKSIRYLMSVKNNYAVVLKGNGRVIGTIGINEDAAGNENARNVGVAVRESNKIGFDGADFPDNCSSFLDNINI